MATLRRTTGNGKLAAPLRRRARAGGLSALEAALEAIGMPALIVGPGGEILLASSKARAVLDRHLLTVSNELAAAAGGAPAAARVWEMTPLRAPGEGRRFLAVLRAAPRAGEIEATIREATLRWRLTARQAEVLDLVAHGLTNLTIAEMLGIGRGTVEFHLSAIFGKAGVENRAT